MNHTAVEPLNYHEIGFLGGIEIHQQIGTRKLFCECEPRIVKDAPDETTERRLHAVASELGEYDPAALHEAHRKRTFHYESYFDRVCLVELDEEPPHPVNQVALEVVLQASLLLNARVVDEIQVMRKTVIDGSNTAGFQRTMLVGTDGVVETSEGDVILHYFCLEEDAARIMEVDERSVHYRLDRLGIPLLEIVTGPVFRSPRQAGEVSDKLGHIIRSLNVRRGIGSIRQDVNVSTKYGTRIEIKGVQKHRMIPLIMENEARRQKALWEIGQELSARSSRIDRAGLQKRTHTVTDLFRSTGSGILRSLIDHGGEVIVISIPSMRGFPARELYPGMRLATEFKDQLLTLGIRGVIHSDEDIGKYGISPTELETLTDVLELQEQDAFILFASRPEVVPLALDKLYERIPACWDGVPKESRRSKGVGGTQYMRPLPGGARMYPETDIPPVIMTQERSEACRSTLPEVIEARVERISGMSGISLHDIWKIEEYLDSFIYGIEELELDPAVVFNVVGSNVVDFRRRRGITFSTEALNLLLDRISRGGALKENVPEILHPMAAGLTIEEIITDLSAGSVDLDAEIEAIIEGQEEILDNPHCHRILMGELMGALRGRIEGGMVSRALATALAQRRPPART